MRNLLIILGLFLFSCTFAYEKKVYLQKPTTLNNAYYGYNYPIYRPIYNPYGNSYYYNPYMYNKNLSNSRRINKIRTIRKLNRQMLKNNFLTWNFGKNSPQNGTLTGYSVPVVQDDIYKQMGISPYNLNPQHKSNSPTCNTDLFSSPQGNEMYYKNGEKRVDLSGTQGKTGVTIIYD